VTASALDRPLAVTKFDSVWALTGKRQTTSLRDAVPVIQQCSRGAKEHLPLLKLASFGDVPNPQEDSQGSLRWDGNVTAIDGIELDYDGKKVPLAVATETLKHHKLAAVVYTSPSYTASEPKWRILCPTSKTLPPAERARLVARVNGAFGNIFGHESFTLSQIFYYGSVNRNPAHVAALIDGRAIDEATELDATAAWKSDPNETRVSNAEAQADILDVAAALRVIPNDEPQCDGRWGRWNNMLMAIRAATGGSEAGREAAEAWSRKNPDHSDEEFNERWDHYDRSPPSRIGAGTIFYKAEQACPGWRNPPGARSTAAEDFGTPVAAPATPGGLRLLSPGECASAVAPPYIVKGLIAEGDVGCIFGPPGAGKSIIAPHIGYAVAQGRAAFGKRTRQGGVFYIAAEDVHGMRGRVHALQLRHGDAPGFYVVDGIGSLLEKADVDALRGLVEQHKPKLIFIDTLAVACPGIDENTSQDMGRVVDMARSLSKLGPAVILIHHDTKDGNGTPRGHSVLNGTLDMSLHLGRMDDSKVIRGKLVKNKRGSLDHTLAFRIDAPTIGTDEDGDPVTAPIAFEVNEAAAPADKLPKMAKAMLTVLREMIARDGMRLEDGRAAVAESTWRTVCDERRLSGGETADSRGKAFRRGFEELTHRGMVVAGGGMVGLCVRDVTEFTSPGVFEDITLEQFVQ
jgi:hypothetical protein